MFQAPGLILVPSIKEYIPFLSGKMKKMQDFGVYSVSCSVKGSLQIYLESLFPLDTEF